MTMINTPQWLNGAIFYQIFPDRFANGEPGNDPVGVRTWGSAPDREHFMGGDLQGIRQRLNALVDLGVNALYLNPIFRAGTNHRYDTYDYYEIDPMLGTKQDFRQLVNEAHEKQIRVVLDAVFNHCGLKFAPFADVMKRGKESPYADWFVVDQYPLESHPMVYQTCGGAEYLPKLNTTNLEVQNYLLDVAEYWIREFDIDGWRLDVPWKADFRLWKRFRERVKQVKQEAYIVGEIWRDTQPWLDGKTCDGTMNYPLREYLLDYCVHDHMDAEDFAYFLTRLLDDLGDNRGGQLNLIGSHDTARVLELAAGDRRKLKLISGLQMLLPGMPMIYYGDEVGMRGANDPDCRRCMPWEPEAWDQELYAHYKKMIQIRRQHTWLTHAEVKVEKVLNGYLALWLRSGAERMLVIANSRGVVRDQTIALDGVSANSLVELISQKHYNIDGNLKLDWIEDRSLLVFKV
ncbi:MAG: glycoside hydrolase family 13 protein [Chloroflexi bacterium]|nr:glycoside hydrolase family 13 protein [Chloroflexota bacterium]